MDSSVKRLLVATWKSPVFRDTFPAEQNAERLAWAEQELGALVMPVTVELSAAVSASLPEWDQAMITRVVEGEVRDKTIAFSAALTAGEIKDLPPLTALCVGVGIMYIDDQNMDRGDESTVEAVELFDYNNSDTSPEQPDNPNAAIVQARSTGLYRILDAVKAMTSPEDRPYVTACFIDQVLKNEAVIYRLSRTYESAASPQDRATFLAEHARQIADTITVTAGFPSISSSLHAIYRQQDPSLPLLSEVYASQDMVDLLQVCNVVARIWDELGDWKMDSGRYPDKGIFVINPFNQYHPDLVGRLCELAFITNPDQVNVIQQAFAGFHHSEADRQTHTDFILQTLTGHIRQYMASFKASKPAVWSQFEQYITLCKRVMEISYVNHIGDIALANPGIVTRP